MNILGLSFGYHDSAAAILRDGEPVFFGNEERYSYQKNDSAFPLGAIQAGLRHTSLTVDDFDAVIYYEDPLLKMDRIGTMATRFHTEPDRYLRELFPGNWERPEKLDPIGMISKTLNIPAARVGFVEHHLSHAALSYFLSPFNRAVIITLDGVGEHETLGVYLGEGTKIEKKVSMKMPNSLGLLYSFFTGFCGFEINEGEYKLMGLAAFGEPTFEDRMARWVDLNLTDPRCSTEMIQWAVPTDSPYSDTFVGQFGEPFRRRHDNHTDTRFADIAASVQSLVEKQLLKLVGAAIAKWDCDAVCLGGGVALNCNANGRIRRELTPNLFVPPAPGDAGSALGATLAWWFRRSAASPAAEKPTIPFTPYLGSQLDEATFASDFSLYRPLVDVEEFRGAAILEKTADCLANGEVVGWMQGRVEMGPRALGNRSILADPRTEAMKDKVNQKIKKRESFRPFAPSILKGHEHLYFDFPDQDKLDDRRPEDFMLATHRVRPEKREITRAVTHVDETSRVHVVAPEKNPTFHALIDAFKRRTGVPILLNTSLNIAGQPLAGDTLCGLYAFLHSEMDRIVIGNKLVSKKS